MPQYRADLQFFVSPAATSARDSLLGQAVKYVLASASFGGDLLVEVQRQAPRWRGAEQGQSTCALSLLLTGPGTDLPNMNAPLKVVVERVVAAMTANFSTGEGTTISANCLRVNAAMRVRKTHSAGPARAKSSGVVDSSRLPGR